MCEPRSYAFGGDRIEVWIRARVITCVGVCTQTSYENVYYTCATRVCANAVIVRASLYGTPGDCHRAETVTTATAAKGLAKGSRVPVVL